VKKVRFYVPYAYFSQWVNAFRRIMPEYFLKEYESHFSLQDSDDTLLSKIKGSESATDSTLYQTALLRLVWITDHMYHYINEASAQRTDVLLQNSDEMVGSLIGSNFLRKEGLSQIAETCDVMNSLEIKSVLRADLGVDPIDLTFKEQVFLYDYLSRVTEDKVEEIRHFASMFGVNGLRTFLSLEHADLSLGDDIIAFGTAADRNNAVVVFNSYAESLDLSDSLTRKFKQQLDEQGIDGRDAGTLSLLEGIEEAMLRRAGQLFTAGAAMVGGTYEGKEQVQELSTAYKGVAKMFDILSRIGDSDQMKVSRNGSREGIQSDVSTFFFDIVDKIENRDGEEYFEERVSLKVTVRPRASERGEARINFELYLDKDTASPELYKGFDQTTEFFGVKGKSRKRVVRGSVIRFGFDLDAKTDPPTFSFDMGRNEYSDETMSRTGDVLGNILAEVSGEGHHLTEFSSQLSDPAQFEQVAQEFVEYFKGVSLIPDGLKEVERLPLAA
jgi:hypothetical protein